METKNGPISREFDHCKLSLKSTKQMTFENLFTILRNNPNEILLNNLTILKNIHSWLSLTLTLL